MDNYFLPAPILIPLGTAFILPIVVHIAHWLRTPVVLLAALATLVTLLPMVEPVFGGETLVYWMGDWTPREGHVIGIGLVIDAFGLLTALIVAGVGLLALVFSTRFLRYESGKNPYYILMLLLIAGLIGFSLSGDLFNQFVWLEVFSVAAFALTGFNVENRRAVEAAFKYLVTNSIASFFIAAGLAVLYMQSGALNLAQAARGFDGSAAAWIGTGLLVGGYATKAAFIPWHFWLPDAHAVAPSPVSAMFSGALIKVGIYAVARTLLTLLPHPLSTVVQTALLTIAALTILIGGWQMLFQASVKRVLAFSSAAQMGYVLFGLALATPLGLAAAAAHMLHHALVKSALFLGAGILQWRTGIHELEEGGGILARMPITGVLMGIAALSLAGLPPFSGMVSKTFIEEALTESGFTLLVLVAIVGSMFTLAGMLRWLWFLFGTHRPTRRDAREAPPTMLVPIALLVAGSVAMGLLWNEAMYRIAFPAGAALEAREHYVATVLDGETEAAHHSEAHALKSPYDPSHLGVPLIVALGGTALGYWALHRERMPITPLLNALAWPLRRWHSGLIGDYVLWNAFGTAIILLVMVLARSA